MEDYKEKYENALERARKINNGDGVPAPPDYTVCETIFPELKESDDERIRKGLIDFLKSPFVNENITDEKVTPWLAWLEKQDPKKHEEELENAYKCADEVQYRMGYEDAKREFESQDEQKPQGKPALEVWKDMRFEVYQQASGNRHEPNYSDDSTKMFSLTDIDEIFEKVVEKQGEKKQGKTPIWNHWKDGIAGNGEGKLIYLIKKGNSYSLSSCLGYECDYILLSDLDKLMLQEKQGKQKPTEWSDRDWYYYSKLESFLEVKDHYSLTESSSGYQKDVHETLIWLKSLRPNKYVTWSEEDEDYYDAIIAKLEVTQGDALLTDNQMEFLKSLKERYTWKPSEEQMEIIYKYAEQNNYDGSVLTSLYQDLKKLMEE